VYRDQQVDLPKGLHEVLCETLGYLLWTEGVNPTASVCVYTQRMGWVHTPASPLVASTNPICSRFDAVREK